MANRYARATGLLGARFPGGVYRLVAALGAIAVLFIALRWRPHSAFVRALRETLPFLACILIYTNLHDTIGFVNPHDIHDRLAAADERLFGVEPTVWAERFITQERTEWMNFLYSNFFWLAPIVPLVLLARRRHAEFRTATFGIVTCFFVGYALYVAFPAAPPRLALAHAYTKSLAGYRLFSRLSAEAFSLLPADSRAAFPSLHAAITLLALVYAWRFVRPLFFVLLPFVIGLWISTVYLRHHFVVDLIAGWVLAPIAYVLAPRIDAWWAARQRRLGFTPARGLRTAD